MNVAAMLDEHFSTMRGDQNRMCQRSCLKLVASEFGLPEEDLGYVDATTWKAMIAKWRDEGYAQSTVRYRCATARRWLQYLAERDLADPSVFPLLKHRAPPVHGARGRCLTNTEIAKILAYNLDTPLRRLAYACFWVQLSLGLRKSELFELRTSWYDASREKILIKDTKTQDQRWLWMPPATRIAVGLHRVHCDPEVPYLLQYIPRGRQPFKMNSTKLRKLYTRMALDCGVTPFMTHDLRRTAAGVMLDNGADVFTVSRILGHKSVQTTLVYDRAPARRQNRAQKAFAKALLDKSPELLAEMHERLLNDLRIEEVA